MTSREFIAKWHASQLEERSAAQEDFIDLCRLPGEPMPAEADPRATMTGARSMSPEWTFSPQSTGSSITSRN